jgi:type II secretory pathway pseudopilin PulG
MKKLHKSAGMALLIEAMILMLVMLILAAMSIPNIVQMGRSQEQNAAKARIQTMAQIQTTLSLCAATSGCIPPIGLTAQLPPPGAIPQGAYVYTYAVLGGGLWSYTATPGQSVFAGTQSFYVDQTGVVRCGNNAGALPC